MNQGKIKISGTGCALADFLYDGISFDSISFSRFLSKKALDLDLQYDKILYALICGCYFRAKYEAGSMLKEDVEFVNKYQHDVKSILEKVCGFNEIENSHIFNEAEEIDMILRYLKY